MNILQVRTRVGDFKAEIENFCSENRRFIENEIIANLNAFIKYEQSKCSYKTSDILKLKSHLANIKIQVDQKHSTLKPNYLSFVQELIILKNKLDYFLTSKQKLDIDSISEKQLISLLYFYQIVCVFVESDFKDVFGDEILDYKKDTIFDEQIARAKNGVLPTSMVVSQSTDRRVFSGPGGNRGEPLPCELEHRTPESCVAYQRGIGTVETLAESDRRQRQLSSINQDKKTSQDLSNGLKSSTSTRSISSFALQRRSPEARNGSNSSKTTRKTKPVRQGYANSELTSENLAQLPSEAFIKALNDEANQSILSHDLDLSAISSIRYEAPMSIAILDSFYEEVARLFLSFTNIEFKCDLNNYNKFLAKRDFTCAEEGMMIRTQTTLLPQMFNHASVKAKQSKASPAISDYLEFQLEEGGYLPRDNEKLKQLREFLKNFDFNEETQEFFYCLTEEFQLKESGGNFYHEIEFFKELISKKDGFARELRFLEIFLNKFASINSDGNLALAEDFYDEFTRQEKGVLNAIIAIMSVNKEDRSRPLIQINISDIGYFYDSSYLVLVSKNLKSINQKFRDKQFQYFQHQIEVWFDKLIKPKSLEETYQNLSKMILGCQDILNVLVEQKEFEYHENVKAKLVNAINTFFVLQKCKNKEFNILVLSSLANLICNLDQSLVSSFISDLKTVVFGVDAKKVYSDADFSDFSLTDWSQKSIGNLNQYLIKLGLHDKLIKTSSTLNGIARDAELHSNLSSTALRPQIAGAADSGKAGLASELDVLAETGEGGEGGLGVSAETEDVSDFSKFLGEEKNALQNLISFADSLNAMNDCSESNKQAYIKTFCQQYCAKYFSKDSDLQESLKLLQNIHSMLLDESQANHQAIATEILDSSELKSYFSSKTQQILYMNISGSYNAALSFLDIEIEANQVSKGF